MPGIPDKSRDAAVGKPMIFAGAAVPRGEKREVSLPLPKLPTQGGVELPVVVIHGATPGPTIWLSAAVHGDELNGIEVIRQIHRMIDPQKLRGSILAVPIVNVFGFLYRNRYLPDGRDLNRSFPGSASGSLAKRLAHIFMTQIVARCEYGIDMHTAAGGRTNLPQIRANLDDRVTLELAKAFAAPVVLDAKIRDGSMRQAAAKRGVAVLLYEAGEAHRFNSDSIAYGVRGVRNVLAKLDMYRTLRNAHPVAPHVYHASTWLRAKQSGILRLEREIGDEVAEGDEVAIIEDHFGRRIDGMRAPRQGTIIGSTLEPLINEGDAAIHLAYHELQV